MHRTEQRRGYAGAVLAFAVIFAIIYYFCLLMPRASDDFAFSAAIHSYSDVFRIAWSKYLEWDGRSIGFLFNHSLIALPPAVSAAVMAALFCLLIFAIHIFVYARDWQRQWRAVSVFSIACFLWACIPAFGAVVFWKTGAGYTYITLLLLGFLLPYRLMFEPGARQCAPHAASAGMAAIFFVYSLYVGLHDYVFPLLFGALAVGVYAYRRWFQRIQDGAQRLFAAGGLGMLLGSALVFASPGNASRVSANPDFLAFAKLNPWEKLLKFMAKIDYIHGWFLLPYLMLAWGIYVLFRHYGSKVWRHFPFWGCVAFVMAQASICAYIFAPVSPRRAFTTTAIMLVLAAALFVVAALPHASRGTRRVLTAAKGIVLAYCLLSVPYEILVLHEVSGVAEKRLEILKSADKTARLPAYPLVEDRFLPIGDNNDIHDVTEDPDFWLNKDLARIWRLESVVRIPAAARPFAPVGGGGEGLTATLQGRHMLFRLSAPVNSEMLYAYYPAKIYDLINPNPLLSFVLDQIAGSAALREALVPVLYKRVKVPLHAGQSAQDFMSRAVRWEHVLPQHMHFYVSLDNRLVRVDELPTASGSGKNGGAL